MNDGLANSSSVMALLVIPREVGCAYFAFAAVFVVGLGTIFVRGLWQKSAGLDKLILFGPIFYAAPLAAFGTEHFTLTKVIASLVPKWIPWHLFWTYFVGACFITAPFSLVTRIQARLSATLLGLNFCFFVVLMDAPGWARIPGNRFALALMLRELAFSGGALGLAASLTAPGRRRELFSNVARYFVAIAVLVYCVQQFMHADHVPGVPLEMEMPKYVFGHAIWTYVAAVGFLAGIPLLIGEKTRIAAACVGATVLLVELIVYVPIAVVLRGSIEGFNYMADTLMFCGAVLMVAGAMPREIPATAVENTSSAHFSNSAQT